MKLIVQIPCYNEEENLPEVLREIPTSIEGIDTIEVLIVNDGSDDNTSQVARENGVHHIIEHKRNLGLAAAFRTGLGASLERGADIIINTDADNQYPSRYIEDLVRPILRGEAEIVIGDRQVNTIPHFSPTKKFFQRLGSRVVRYVSNTHVPDAPSGFRAITSDAALRINIFTNYTYTLEMIIQAGLQNMTIKSVPITTNPKTRESRLIRSIPSYILRSAMTILYLFVLYKAFRFFMYLSLPFWMVGGGLWLRFFLLLALDETSRGSNVQSILLGSVLVLLGFMTILFGFIAELVGINRKIQETSLYYIRRTMLNGLIARREKDQERQQ
jgi:glycosyltransferase involved in cell wall biosynthesis